MLQGGLHLPREVENNSLCKVKAGGKTDQGGYVCMYERMRDNRQIVYRISGYIPYRPLHQQPPLSNSC